MTPPTPERDAERSLALGLAASLAALIAFAWLAGHVARGAALSLDQSTRAFVHAHASPPLTSVMRFVTGFGSTDTLVILGFLACAALFASGDRRAALLTVITMCGGSLLDATLKLSFQRARPEPFFDYPLPDSYSFPSGHALMSVCFFGLLAIIVSARFRSLAARAAVWVVAVVSVLLVGLSRIYLGVHYPSDVIGGYAAAVIWVSAVSHTDNLLRQRARRPGAGDAAC